MNKGVKSFASSNITDFFTINVHYDLPFNSESFANIFCDTLPNFAAFQICCSSICEIIMQSLLFIALKSFTYMYLHQKKKYYVNPF